MTPASSAATPFSPATFTWIAGIEDTCVYPSEQFAMEPLDEHLLTGHDVQWRSDLDAIAALGATALRYGVDWPRVHTAPGVFDWSTLDERLAHASGIGLTVIADLVHYGTPTWLGGSFADREYPAAIAQFASAFAERYAGIVNHFTPLNEPVTTASFAGLRGVWPPALHGWTGWTRVVLGIADGMQQTVHALRAANPAASIVHVEATSAYSTSPTASPALAEEAALLNRLGFVPTDLMLGLLTPDHESYGWLIDQGAAPEELARIASNLVDVDLLGVNFYPDLSPRVLGHLDDGSVVQTAYNGWTEGLRSAIRSFEDRYRLPMLITETSIEGDDDVRSRWARESVETVRELIAEGIDIRGWTWWPVFDFVDWSYASGGTNVEEFMLPDELVDQRRSSTSVEPYLRRMGLIRLESDAGGTLRRVPTRAADTFHAMTIETPALQP